MKLTKSKLKQLIKEELAKVLKENRISHLTGKPIDPRSCEEAQLQYTAIKNILDSLYNTKLPEEDFSTGHGALARAGRERAAEEQIANDIAMHEKALTALENKWPDCNFTITVGDNLGPPRPKTEEEAEGPPPEEPRPKYTGPQRW